MFRVVMVNLVDLSVVMVNFVLVNVVDLIFVTVIFFGRMCFRFWNLTLLRIF
jgi:hypothetical protein